jgi:hypothetical protein
MKECVQNYCGLSCADPSSCCPSNHTQSCLIGANLQSPCFNIENSVVFCSTYLPTCLCYDPSGQYAPDGYDSMAQSCYEIATTASPDLVSFLTGSSGAVGFCTRFAGPGVATSQTGVVAPTTSTTATTPRQTSPSGVAASPTQVS